MGGSLMTLDNTKSSQLNEILSSLDSWFNQWPLIDQKRSDFLDYNEDSRGLPIVRNEIAESWARSKNKGIFPQREISSKTLLQPYLFDKVLRDNRTLLQTTQPILREVASDFSRMNSFGIGLVDRNAILLSVHNFPLKQIQPGLDFSEDKIGTSAVSISLAQNKPAYLFGSEVYNEVLRFSKFIVSIPFHDLAGRVAGFFVAPYFQKLQYTEEEKQLLSFLVTWQFSTAEKIQQAIHNNRPKQYVLDPNNRVKIGDGLEAVYSFQDIIGNSPSMLKAKEIAYKIAHSPGDILLAGESGTGKELFAHAIHNECCSPGPFVAINCAAIPENLIESELFGYEGGSFSGAERKGRMGKMEMANGGTLFLDEIGDMPLSLQPVLLRVIDDRKVMRVGGNKYLPTNFRIISATNKDLYEMVKRKEFREDLYFRLAALKLQIPPLRNRGRDIIDLAQFYIKQSCDQLNIPLLEMEPDVIECLLCHDWPGNIRELKNYMLWAVTLADRNICLRNLPDEILKPDIKPGNEDSYIHMLNLKQRMIQELEIESIKKTMTQCDNNISKAAKILGISRPTLYRKLETYDLDNT